MRERSRGARRSTFIKRSPIRRSTKPIRKVNPVAKAKRTVRYRKMLSGKEYREARRDAFVRAGNRCELWLSWTDRGNRENASPFELTGTLNATTTHVQRCPVVFPEPLHAHHKSYPKARKLLAADLTICCKPHHEYLESLKPHKQRMF